MIKYLGLDYGQAKVGVALGSDETKLAVPLAIIRFNHEEALFEKLKEIVAAEAIDALVVGQPVSLSGDVLTADSFQAFVALIKRLNLPLHFEDERFSTNAAGKMLREVGKGRADDAVAAQLILQSFFDRSR
jgi:putative Holliday junction resolvase